MKFRSVEVMVNDNKVRMKVKVKFNMRVGQKSKTRIFGRQGES